MMVKTKLLAAPTVAAQSKVAENSPVCCGTLGSQEHELGRFREENVMGKQSESLRTHDSPIPEGDAPAFGGAQLPLKRRTLLLGAAAVGALSTSASAASSPSDAPSSVDLTAALARFRASIPSNFDREYVEHVVIPFFLTSIIEGERPILPMIDVTLTKQDALPFDLWGLIYEAWEPSPEEGVTVFLQGLEERGDNNLRKRIYFSALTPDLYHSMYQAKVTAFFDGLLDAKFAGKPFMRHYLDYYFDIYWDLHVGVKGDAIPPQVRTIGESFNTVLAYRDPTQEIVYENYMTVRALLPFLKEWIDARVDDVANARVSAPEKTFVYYWLKNAGDGKHFSKKDIVFEVFHNFVALSQWGNSIFGVMSRLAQDGGDPAVRASFQRTMSGDFDNASGAPFTPLELLVMELFRTISPNGGSISAVTDARASAYGSSPFIRFGVPYERHAYIATPHTSTSFDSRLWKEPDAFDPERYKSVPTSAQIDDAKCQQIGLPRCPFEITTLPVSDGRKAGLTNSGFGTVFGVADGKPLPVCDYAGFAPFGFGYRRCPGEQLTIDVFADFLRKVWRDKIVFRRLNAPNPARVPVGPNAVVDDDLGFSRTA
jgi:hypothetical protein